MEIDLQAVEHIADPAQRAQHAHQAAAQYQALVSELYRIRRGALDELVSQGRTHAQIAELLGMTRGRVTQLLTSGPRPERIILGSGRLVVAAGGKVEADKSEPGRVLSVEALDAYDRLADLARSLGLDVERDVVPPPGMVNLNRPNLVVLGSPRILPFVAQVLDADESYGFANDAHGWYLIDRTTDTIYRSPMDAGEPSDYAYIGRLPRPDGRGTFLYLAGIHAPGTAGASYYLERHLAELYGEVKNRRWSALIRCQFDPDNRSNITAADLLTPIRHG